MNTMNADRFPRRFPNVYRRVFLQQGSFKNSFLHPRFERNLRLSFELGKKRTPYYMIN